MRGLGVPTIDVDGKTYRLKWGAHGITVMGGEMPMIIPASEIARAPNPTIETIRAAVKRRNPPNGNQ